MPRRVPLAIAFLLAGCAAPPDCAVNGERLLNADQSNLIREQRELRAEESEGGKD